MKKIYAVLAGIVLAFSFSTVGLVRPVSALRACTQEDFVGYFQNGIEPSPPCKEIFCQQPQNTGSPTCQSDEPQEDNYERNVNGSGGACKEEHFLGLRAWYDGLVYEDASNGNKCTIMSPAQLLKGTGFTGTIDNPTEGKEALTKYVWTIVLNVATMALQIVGYLAVGFVIWGGYQYILAKGDPGKVAQGRKTILNAIIGLSICMSASIITSAVSDIVSGASGADVNFFTEIFNKALLWAGIIATIFMVWGGVQYAMSDGDPSKVTKAKNTIMNAVIGLVITVLAALIVNLVVKNMS